MSIELLPFSAFALESCAAPARTPGDGQTLTLSQLATCLLSLRATEVALPGSQHTSVALLADEPLTITF
jgi:hypothetical protein